MTNRPNQSDTPPAAPPATPCYASWCSTCHPRRRRQPWDMQLRSGVDPAAVFDALRESGRVVLHETDGRRRRGHRRPARRGGPAIGVDPDERHRGSGERTGPGPAHRGGSGRQPDHGARHGRAPDGPRGGPRPVRAGVDATGVRQRSVRTRHEDGRFIPTNRLSRSAPACPACHRRVPDPSGADRFGATERSAVPPRSRSPPAVLVPATMHRERRRNRR